MFIVIDGIDGGGKTTVAKHLLKAYLDKDKGPASYFKFPSNCTAPGNLVRRIFNGEEHVEDRRAMVYLITADSLCMMDRLRAASREGFAVADRYSLSSGWVYQTSEGWRVDDLYDVVKPELFVIPDHTFIVDVPAPVALQRIEARVKDGTPKNTMYEERLALKRDKYLAFQKMEPFGPCSLIDGRGTPHEVYQEIIDRLVEGGLWT